MAHSLSAKKRVRQNEKRRARNRARKSELREVTKSFTSTLGKADIAKSEEALRAVVQKLDRTAAKGTIHKNTAARRRSRLTKRLNAAKAKGAGTSAATA